MRVSDAEYVFQQDIREKKSAGRGIYHKKNGSKTKKCRLPSDYMTKRERDKMNSEVTTWDMKKFYTYAEFKKMPDDLKADYINGLIMRYNVTMTNIAEELFNMSPNGFWAYMHKHGGHEKLVKAKRGKVTSKADLSRFQDDILKSMEPNANTETDKPTVENTSFIDKVDQIGEKKQETITEESKDTQLVYASISTKGFDKELFDYLASRYGSDEIVVTITVTNGSNYGPIGGCYSA